MNLFYYIKRLILCLLLECSFIYIAEFINDKYLIAYLIIIFFTNFCVAAYACNVWERMLKYIRKTKGGNHVKRR